MIIKEEGTKKPDSVASFDFFEASLVPFSYISGLSNPQKLESGIGNLSITSEIRYKK